MKQFSQQLHKKAQTTVKLQVAEQRELRERVLSYMEYHPLPAELKNKQVKSNLFQDSSLFNEPISSFSLPFFSFFKSSATIAVILLLIIPFIAEKAVPGDTLYAVKVSFNEEVRSTLTFDGYQKVEWETERVNRRVAEARLLASEGRLTEVVEAEVAEAVRVHTESAKREIEALRIEDADDAAIASIALDTTLEVQSASLKEVIDTMDSTAIDSRGTSLIANVIDESRGQTAEEDSTSSLPAYEKLMARVEQNTTRIHELHDALKTTVSVEELNEVSRRITDIEREFQSVIVQNTTDETQSKLLLIDVLQRTQKLIVYMTELEVSNIVDLEQIVPVILTNEEKQAEINKLTNDVDNHKEQIDVLLQRIKDDSVKDKANYSLTVLDDLSTKMASSTDNFTVFTTYANEAIVLADDMIILLEKYTQPSTTEVGNVGEIGDSGDLTSTSTEEVTNETVQTSESNDGQ